VTEMTESRRQKPLLTVVGDTLGARTRTEQHHRTAQGLANFVPPPALTMPPGPTTNG